MPQLSLPVFWQGISGGVEDAETLDQAANRELLEETGIGDVPIYHVGFSRAIPIQREWIKVYPKGTTQIIEHTFVCILPEPIPPKLSWEHTEYAWLQYSDAYDGLYYQGNKESLSAAHTWLTTRTRKKHDSRLQ